MELSTGKSRHDRSGPSQRFALLWAVAMLLTAWGAARIEATAPPATSPASAECPNEAPLEPGARSQERAIAAVRKSLDTGLEEWRTYQIRSAYPATTGKGFSVVALSMCGPVVGSRTWVVENYFPTFEPSASLSQAQAFVSRFRSGWRVWYRYH